jgi:hypothetical protein
MSVHESKDTLHAAQSAVIEAIEKAGAAEGLCIFSTEATIDDCGIWDDDDEAKLCELLGFKVSRDERFVDVVNRYMESLNGKA